MIETLEACLFEVALLEELDLCNEPRATAIRMI